MTEKPKENQTEQKIGNIMDQDETSFSDLIEKFNDEIKDEQDVLNSLNSLTHQKFLDSEEKEKVKGRWDKTIEFFGFQESAKRKRQGRAGQILGKDLDELEKLGKELKLTEEGRDIKEKVNKESLEELAKLFGEDVVKNARDNVTSEIDELTGPSSRTEELRSKIAEKSERYDVYIKAAEKAEKLLNSLQDKLIQVKNLEDKYAKSINALNKAIADINKADEKINPNSGKKKKKNQTRTTSESIQEFENLKKIAEGMKARFCKQRERIQEKINILKVNKREYDQINKRVERISDPAVEAEELDKPVIIDDDEGEKNEKNEKVQEQVNTIKGKVEDFLNKNKDEDFYKKYKFEDCGEEIARLVRLQLLEQSGMLGVDLQVDENNKYEQKIQDAFVVYEQRGKIKSFLGNFDQRKSSMIDSVREMINLENVKDGKNHFDDNQKIQEKIKIAQNMERLRMEITGWAKLLALVEKGILANQNTIDVKILEKQLNRALEGEFRGNGKISLNQIIIFFKKYLLEHGAGKSFDFNKVQEKLSKLVKEDEEMKDLVKKSFGESYLSQQDFGSCQSWIKDYQKSADRGNSVREKGFFEFLMELFLGFFKL